MEHLLAFFVMGRQKNATTVEVCEHVYVKQHRVSRLWHYYFRLNGRAYRASTKTTHLPKAKLKALEIYLGIVDGRVISIKSISFNDLIERYCANLHGQTKLVFHSETLARHFLPFFSKFDTIASITKGDLNDYLLYRKKKSAFKVLNQSINKENVVFNQAMRMALEYNWITEELKLKRLSEAGSRNRRPHFTPEQYDILIRTAKMRCEAFNPAKLKGQKSGLVVIKYWQRHLLYNVIIILANSGMRVDEIKTVQWCDINWLEMTIKLHKAGKTKSIRTLLIRKEGVTALNRLLQARKLHAAELDSTSTKIIHSLPNGTFVNSFKKGFRDLLKDCGFIKYQAVTDRHSLTSLRHTYATNRLKEGVSMRALAKQMGPFSLRIQNVLLGNCICRKSRTYNSPYKWMIKIKMSFKEV